MRRQKTPQPAIFYDVDGTHKADTCENLKIAKARGELFHSAYAHGCYPGLSQYFATSFKKKTGQSPSTFRQRAS